jgi:hypothetical protein
MAADKSSAAVSESAAPWEPDDDEWWWMTMVNEIFWAPSEAVAARRSRIIVGKYQKNFSDMGPQI